MPAPKMAPSRRPAVSLLLRLARAGGLGAVAVALALTAPVLSNAETPDPAGPAAPPPPFALSVVPEGAMITGLAPGGEALLFSIAREPLGYFSRVSRRDELLTADETGTAVFVPLTAEGEPMEMPAKAVWVAVDLATGSVATAVPEGFDAPRRGLPANALRRGPSQRVDRLVDRLEAAQWVYVRPGAPEARGIWGLFLMDGSSLDDDAQDDGGLEMALDRLQPLLGSGAPPEEVLPGDVVAVVDPASLAYFAVRIGA